MINNSSDQNISLDCLSFQTIDFLLSFLLVYIIFVKILLFFLFLKTCHTFYLFYFPVYYTKGRWLDHESCTNKRYNEQYLLRCCTDQASSFVVEQGVPLSREIDKDEAHCIHFVLYSDKKNRKELYVFAFRKRKNEITADGDSF